MFKKKCLFGGLGLGNAIAIFASISSDVIAMEAVKAKNSIHDFRSELNQIAWDRACSFKEYAFQYLGKQKEYSWILDDKYKDSRTKVIGKAIGDCVAREGAFANKAPEEIITFKDTDPKTYKQRNWNAVILYNYIHEAINGEAFKEFFTAGCGAIKAKENKENYVKQLSDVRGVLKNKLEKLKEHYKAEYSKKCTKRLDKAVEHIQKYVETLQLNRALRRFRYSKERYNFLGDDVGFLAPEADSNGTNAKNGGRICFHQPYYFEPVKLSDGGQIGFHLNGYVTLKYHDHDLYISNIGLYREFYQGTELTMEELRKNSNWKRCDDTYLSCKNIHDMREHANWLVNRLLEFGFVKLPDEKQLETWDKEKASKK